jgi:hypothetical protein
MKPPKNGVQKGSKSAATARKGLTEEELAALREHVQELKAAARRGSRASKAKGENDVLAKIAEMQEPDRAMAQRKKAVA